LRDTIGGAPTGGINFPREDVVKQYHTSEGAALAEAENLAKKYPGEQFAVFAVKAIRESKATLIKKTINEAGEIVVDKDAS
jgi:hypothetical protein